MMWLMIYSWLIWSAFYRPLFVNGGRSTFDVCELCICDGTKLDCDSRGLNDGNFIHVAKVIPKRMTSLSFSGNLLTHFPVTAFERLTEVQTLNLSRNLLTEIPLDFYNKFPRLRTLDLASNRIRESLARVNGSARSNPLKYLAYLENLRLNNNLFVYVDPKIFKDTPKLNRLDLSKNFIQDLNPSFFEHFEDANLSIDFDENPIEEISESKFGGNRSFGIISFRRCKISFIHPKAFVWNITISELRLDYNKLARLPQALTDLRESNVSLYGNHFSCDCHTSSMLRKIEQLGTNVNFIGARCKKPAYLWLRKIVNDESFRNDTCVTCVKNETACDSRNVTCLECQCLERTQYGTCRTATNHSENVFEKCRCTSYLPYISAGSVQSVFFNSDSSATDSKWVIIGVVGFVVVFFLVMTMPVHLYCRRRVHKRQISTIRDRLISRSSKSDSDENQNNHDVTMTDFCDVTMSDVDGDVIVFENARDADGEEPGCSKTLEEVESDHELLSH